MINILNVRPAGAYAYRLLKEAVSLGGLDDSRSSLLTYYSSHLGSAINQLFYHVSVTGQVKGK